MNVSGIDTQDPAEIGEFEGVFGTFGMLFEVPGQSAVAVRHRAEVDAPAQRYRGEAPRLRFTCGNLELDLVPGGNRFDRGTGVDPIDLDPVKTKSVDGPTERVNDYETGAGSI